MPMCSLGTWTIVESSPLTPVLCHRDRFIFGASHILNFRINVSLPGVYWPSVFLFPLSKLYGDAIILNSKSVTNPNSYSSFLLAVDLSWSTKYSCCLLCLTISHVLIYGGSVYQGMCLTHCLFGSSPCFGAIIMVLT